MEFKKKIISIVLILSTLFTASAFAQEKEYSLEYEIYKQMAELIAQSYIDENLTQEEIITNGISELLKNDEEMLVELLKSTFKSLDEYSEFFTAEEYKEYVNNLNRTFYGIGIVMADVGGYTEITGFVEEDGPAQKAGFKIGDKIVAVDGIDVVGKSKEYVRTLVVGDINTTVTLRVKRGEELIDIIAVRNEVKQETVTGGVLTGNIGYVKIRSFGNDTANEFADVMSLFEQNVTRKVILDLRDNPGGIVNIAVEIAKMIVPKGKIIDVKYRNESKNLTYYSELIKPELQFYVLVNENTASSAEILASAIQDSGVGQLMGTKTFGKAVIQQSFTLTNGSVYKLTTGQYITRNGSMINGKGLTPDYYVENYMEKIDVSQYSKPDFENRYALGNTAEAIKAAKERLYLLGIYNGSVENGFFGEDFQNALKSFQENNHLSPNGVLDIATQIILDRQFARLEREVDKQLQMAYTMFGGNIDNLY